MNLPNKLTVLRIVLVPFFVLALSFRGLLPYTLAYIVFVVATVTDYYDGKLARKHQMITNFGKLLDPVADKVLVVSAYIMLLRVPDLHVPGWAVIAIIAREFLVTGIRSLAASEGAVIAANNWGKAKMVLQVGYVCLFFGLAIVLRGLDAFLSIDVAAWQALLYASSFWAALLVALVTLYSGIQFVVVNWAKLHLGDL